MKNSIILKDELSILKEGRSAVLTELALKTKELKDTISLITKAEKQLADVIKDKQEEMARLDDIRGRANSFKREVGQLAQEAKSNRVSWEAASVRNAQEVKLHLGRIKELKDAEQECLDRISELKRSYDKSSDLYISHLSEKKSFLRELDTEIESKQTLLKDLTKQLVSLDEEKKRATKERLKREDKIREREKNLAGKEFSLGKREEDMNRMSKDMMIMYGRLKEIYSKEKPEVDLDKLIMPVK